MCTARTATPVHTARTARTRGSPSACWRDFKERWGSEDIGQARRALTTADTLVSAAAVDPIMAAQVGGGVAERAARARRHARLLRSAAAASTRSCARVPLCVLWVRFVCGFESTLQAAPPAAHLHPSAPASPNTLGAQMVWTVAYLADGSPQLTAALARGGVDLGAEPAIAKLRDGSGGLAEERWCSDLLSTARTRGRR